MNKTNLCYLSTSDVYTAISQKEAGLMKPSMSGGHTQLYHRGLQLCSLTSSCVAKYSHVLVKGTHQQSGRVPQRKSNSSKTDIFLLQTLFMCCLCVTR